MAAFPAPPHARRLSLPTSAVRLQQAAAYRGPLLKHVIRVLAVDTDLWTDTTWIVDSTPVECGRSRDTARRSELVGWAGYGYCSSHSRFFWGLRLHLICTPAGLPITWALATPKLDERQVLMAILEHDPAVLHDRPGLLIIADKGYVSRELDGFLADRGVRLLRPNYRNRTRPNTCSNQFDNSSSRSTTPSKANSTWSCTAAAPSTA